MTGPAGAEGKRGKKFSRSSNRREREKKISTEFVLRALFERACKGDSE